MWTLRGRDLEGKQNVSSVCGCCCCVGEVINIRKRGTEELAGAHRMQNNRESTDLGYSVRRGLPGK